MRVHCTCGVFPPPPPPSAPPPPGLPERAKTAQEQRANGDQFGRRPKHGPSTAPRGHPRRPTEPQEGPQVGPDPLGQRSLLPVSWQDRHQRAPEAPAAGDAAPPVADSAAPGAPEPALLIVGQRRRAAGQTPIQSHNGRTTGDFRCLFLLRRFFYSHSTYFETYVPAHQQD